MRNSSVILIDMPWSLLEAPSIQLGTLKSVLQHANIRSEVRPLNLAFMHHVRVADALSPGEVPISPHDYMDVADEYYHLGLGDWIFACPPFRKSSPQEDDRYFDFFRSKGGKEETVTKAQRMRALVPSFLERCVADILSTSPRIVGFTTTFSQNVPALVLAKLLKLRDPSLKIIFGGSNCDGPMGDALHREFPWIDVVLRGEAENVLPQLVRDVFAGKEIQPQPGLCYRSGGERIVIGLEGAEVVSMDQVPTPNYDEYFGALEENACRAEIMPRVMIPFESSRGCWWGAKKHCTFCGLNDLTIAFRSKRPTIVIQELIDLSQKYGHLDFYGVDNIIDMRYFKELLPKLRQAGYDFRLFYETKANLKSEHLQMMREAGVSGIQPGIESLSTPILKLMEKGVTALQNMRLLKRCAEFGIRPHWNFIYGFPREPPEEYPRMAEAIKSITHLTPPQSLTPLHLERFSPYHQRPGSYGLKINAPTQAAYYHLIYPTDEATLNDLAYTFDYSYDDGRDATIYVAPLRESIEAWRRDYLEGSNLSYRRGPGLLLINDRRCGLGGCDYSFQEREAKIYLACDVGATPMLVWKGLLADGFSDVTLEDVENFLHEMVELRLMYEEGGCYLSLAVAVNPGMHNGRFEIDDVVSTNPEVVHRQIELSPG